MKISSSMAFDEVRAFALKKHSDERGCVVEVFHSHDFSENTNHEFNICASHETISRKGVLRGLHYQINSPQARLLRVSQGIVFDVVVDIRKSSPTFGRWQAEILSSDSIDAMWIPHGFAHGYYVLSDSAIVNVYTDHYWNSNDQRCIKWDDSTLAIEWPILIDYPVYAPPIISHRDKLGKSFLEAEVFA